MRLRFPALLLISALALAACESSEERAERFYQSGMQLLEAGDVDRALLEFRNVFKLNGKHKEARLAFARIQRERGKAGEAYGQYLRLAEQYPDLLEAQVALAEIAIEGGSWEDAERYGRAAQGLAPDDPQVVLINAALDYRKAVVAKDTAAQAAPIAVARAALQQDPANLMAWRMVIDQKVGQGDARGALPDIDAALKAHPDQLSFHMLRLQLLNEVGDTAALQPALEAMAAQFPENLDVQKMLIAWYLDQGDTAAAEAFLRKLAEAPGTPEDQTTAKLTVVEFLRQTQGNEAATAELDRLVAAEPGNKTYQAARASLTFEAGQTAEAIAAMETLLKDAEPSDEIRTLKIALARMLLATDNAVGARARVEEVLAEDPNQVEALKMQATWLIADDKPGDAIIALRTALAQAPRDVSVITLMAEAHEREGSRDLAGERYALAVEVSNRAPEQSIRYATFLMTDGKIDGAEAVLEESLRNNPGEVGLLAALAEVQLRQRDWDRVATTVAQLRQFGMDDADATADAIEAELLLRQDRIGDTLAFLQEKVASGDADIAAKARMVQIQVQDGRLDEAAAFLDTELAATPDEPTLRFLRAGLYVLENDPAQAETLYRDLLKTAPSDQAIRALYALLVAQGRQADADAMIDEVLAANPTAVLPRLFKASRLEQAKDFDGAIAVYESLYAEDSSNLIVANNLASLITTHRSDPADLDRAFAIARRLRGSDVPAFQDTYGWIEARRGNYEEALKYLEPAAAGLPEDALTQFHLGMTYVALKRTDEARATLQKALEIAGDSPLPQFEEARKALAGLGAE